MSTLSGVVTVDGAPATGAVVELHNASGDVVTQVIVDASGSYKFHLSEGEWSVRSWDSLGHRGAGRATLTASEDTSLDLALEPAG
jgi:hypothetical protein